MNTGAVIDIEAEYLHSVTNGNTALAERLAARMESERATHQARLESPTALRDAALWYASKNIAVFPLEPRGKRPATKNGFKDATTSIDAVRAWWTHHPDSNIGAPTGITFDVIDIDGPQGVVTWLTELADELPPRIGHATTARDAGHHLFVRPVEGRGNKAALFPGIDYRGAGGYVVLPPSVGANGRRYAWLRPLELP